jgi:hypothetical protein
MFVEVLIARLKEYGNITCNSVLTWLCHVLFNAISLD